MHEAPKEISILRSTLYKRTPENGIEPKNKIRVGDVGNSVSAFIAQVQISIDPLRYTCKSNNGNKRLGEWMPRKTRSAIVRRNTRLGLAIPRVFFFFVRSFYLWRWERKRRKEGVGFGYMFLRICVERKPRLWAQNGCRLNTDDTVWTTRMGTAPTKWCRAF